VGYGSDTAWQGSSGSSSQTSWNWQVGLPVLVGINLGSYQVVVSPELLYQRVAALPEGILDAGGTLAVGKVGGSGSVSIRWWRSGRRSTLANPLHPQLRGPGAHESCSRRGAAAGGRDELNAFRPEISPCRPPEKPWPADPAVHTKQPEAHRKSAP
jgi:hypothetical protein